ncbi:hypothetical protein EVAR_21815_1 [Eumeta japonica]|uniref:Uncharacterized protein n=1 Tax=Eumeta variegata TaxID=151549 RepID=A0A4C1SCS3_EUMVA|nr:hypothetical protein EVAR_21815_1 [Eumeta japonica]
MISNISSGCIYDTSVDKFDRLNFDDDITAHGWAGHLERVDDTSVVKTISDWTPLHKRPKRRPRQRWKDCVDEELRNVCRKTFWKKEAKDKVKWKEIVEVANTRTGSLPRRRKEEELCLYNEIFYFNSPTIV